MLFDRWHALFLLEAVAGGGEGHMCGCGCKNKKIARSKDFCQCDTLNSCPYSDIHVLGGAWYDKGSTFFAFIFLNDGGSLTCYKA